MERPSLLPSGRDEPTKLRRGRPYARLERLWRSQRSLANHATIKSQVGRGVAINQLELAGFEIEHAEEAETPMVFRTLEGLVYYLRIVPWAVEGFDPVVDRDTLELIQERIEEDGHLRICGSHMLMEGVKR